MGGKVCNVSGIAGENYLNVWSHLANFTGFWPEIFSPSNLRGWFCSVLLTIGHPTLVNTHPSEIQLLLVCSGLIDRFRTLLARTHRHCWTSSREVVQCDECEAIRQSWPLQKVFFSDCCLRFWFHALVFLKSKFVHARGRSALFILNPTPTLVRTFQKSGFSVLSVAEICGWQLEVQRQIERRQGVAGRWGTQMCSWVKLQDQESRGHYWKNGSQRNMVKNPRTCNVWYIIIHCYIIYIYIIVMCTSSSILGCHVKCSGL